VSNVSNDEVSEELVDEVEAVLISLLIERGHLTEKQAKARDRRAFLDAYESLWSTYASNGKRRSRN
jgi:hypothetical protein